MGEYDCVILRLMQEYDIPGGAVAVVKDGRLVFAKGYGYADVDSYEQVQPDSLFRIASLSKAITAAATLKLVEDGLLELDTPVFDVLGRLEPSPAGPSMNGFPTSLFVTCCSIREDGTGT